MVPYCCQFQKALFRKRHEIGLFLLCVLCDNFVPFVVNFSFFNRSPSTSFDFSSFRQKPESRKTSCKSLVWIPALVTLEITE